VSTALELVGAPSFRSSAPPPLLLGPTTVPRSQAGSILASQSMATARPGRRRACTCLPVVGILAGREYWE
jgi:hypothetical protein